MRPQPRTPLKRVNWLFDKSQTPHMHADELCRQFELSSKIGAVKPNFDDLIRP